MASRPLLQDSHLFDRAPSVPEVGREFRSRLESRGSALWWAAFSVSFTILLLGVLAVSYQLWKGIGTWGLNNTVGWAFDITNFVFWIGLGHAGTFISAILFLLRQNWRTSIGRSAETITLISVLCAAIFPIIHMGRPWLAFWMLPYPNYRGPLWINFRSPLVWDFFAIGTYFTVSFMFWYLGLLPDFASIRDNTRSRFRRVLFSLLSLGWNNSIQTWKRYETVYLLLAGLATALVISVHSIVSWDFAVSIIPGWHSTIFPPYFVVGAIFSGMAMVAVMSILIRSWMGLKEYITARHLDRMAKILLAGSLFIGLTYVVEVFFSLYSGNEYEQFTYWNRLFGGASYLFLIMVVLNVLMPQVLWLKGARRTSWTLLLVSIGILCGMWIERLVIVAGSLQRDFLASSWTDYTPTIIEIMTLAGSFGLFFTLFLLFCRFFPVIPISETQRLIDTLNREGRR